MSPGESIRRLGRRPIVRTTQRYTSLETAPENHSAPCFPRENKFDRTYRTIVTRQGAGLGARCRPEAENEEDVLVDRAVAGDELAFTKLHDLYRGRIYSYLNRRAVSPHDAEDLTQDVFLLAWRAIGRYRRAGSPFVAWLIAIAHNTVVSYHRRRHRIEQWLDDDEVEHAAEANSSSGTDGLIDQLTVQKLLQRLRPHHKQVLTLRFLDDLSHRDVARTLRKSEANVRVLQHRALEEVRRRMEPA